jgi:hypothetical protein
MERREDMKREMLEIRGFENVLVHNTFLNQDSSHLVIIFPGIGYSAAMPMLYYSSFILESKGVDILPFHYKCKTEAFQALSKEDQHHHIIMQQFMAKLTAFMV